jgi:hypothetical protein
VKELNLLLIGVNVVASILCQVVKLLGVLIDERFPWHRSKNSESLWRIVPADNWWAWNATLNSSHGTW